MPKEHLVVEDGGLQTVLLFEGIADALVVTQRVVQRGRDHLDVVGTDRGVDVDLAIGDRLAHHLAARARFLGNEDHEVAVDLGDAGQPEALGSTRSGVKNLSSTGMRLLTCSGEEVTPNFSKKPSSIRTLHLPHVRFSPQIASISTPSSRLASRTDLPSST